MPTTSAFSSLTIRGALLALGFSWGGFIDDGAPHTVTAWILMVLSTVFALVTVYGRLRAAGPVTFERIATDVANGDTAVPVVAVLAPKDGPKPAVAVVAPKDGPKGTP
jgi:hypothetical protein